MKTRLITLLSLVVVIAFVLPGETLSTGAQSQATTTLDRITLTLGSPPDAQSTTGPTPPPGINVLGESGTANSEVVIRDTPAYVWHHGCGPTAAGMVVGYWDTHGFDDLVPGDASTQTATVDAMIASEGPASNYSDYCEPIDSPPAPIKPDKSEPPVGDEHPDDCVADYMKTSQSYHNNYYGWSWFSHVGPAMENYVNALGHSDYLVTVDNLYMHGPSTLNWDSYRAEIDAGRPMVFLVDTNGDGGTDHFVTAIGYATANGVPKYACLNTWDTGIHWFDFAPMAPGQPWGIYGAVTFEIVTSTAGKIVVNNDEWALSDQGFPPAQDTDAAPFALNVADWFTDGEPGDFLVYSTPFGLTTGLAGTELATAMTTAGHTWTVISTTTSFSLTALLQYDGIFLAGSQVDDFKYPPPVVPPDTQLLIDYVEAGGNVYLAGGTDPGGPASEAAQWNPFLNACGLEFEPSQNNIDGTLVFTSSHTIFAGVQRLFQRDGNSINRLNPSDPGAAILVQSEAGEGLYAVCSIGAPIQGAPTVTAIVIPTAVELIAFTADAGPDHITLAWQTASETDNEGFNLWRSQAAGGEYTQLNAALIPAQGNADIGASYSYTDADVLKGVTYYYKLQDVDIHGHTTFHGPVSATPSQTWHVYLPLTVK